MNYNTICMVTNQLITAGAKVKIFPLLPNAGYKVIPELTPAFGCICYPNAFYQTLGIYFEAVYTSNSIFELAVTPQNTLMLKMLYTIIATYGVSVDTGDDEYDYEFFNPAVYSDVLKKSEDELYSLWPTLNDVAFDDTRCFLKAVDGTCGQLCLGVVHESAYEYLRNSVAQTEPNLTFDNILNAIHTKEFNQIPFPQPAHAYPNYLTFYSLLPSIVIAALKSENNQNLNLCLKLVLDFLSFDCGLQSLGLTYRPFVIISEEPSDISYNDLVAHVINSL